MDTEKISETPGLSLRLPVITLGMVSAAVLVAVVAAYFPGLSNWLVYDRSAILSGQIWRLYTGHWVHFSSSHLVYDALTLGMAGWMIETQRLRYFGWFCVFAPWLISSGMLLAAPQMQGYGGLSALAVAAVAYLVLGGLHQAGGWRWICAATLLGLVAKIMFEVVTGKMLFVPAADGEPAVAVVGHACGMLVGALFYGWEMRKLNRVA